jgi:hypothetical protein
MCESSELDEECFTQTPERMLNEALFLTIRLTHTVLSYLKTAAKLVINFQ